MIYLHEELTHETLAEARWQHLVNFVCAAAGHPAATRLGLNTTVCLCGGWHRKPIFPADTLETRVTIDALRRELAQVQRRNMDLTFALDDAINYLNDGGHEATADRLADVIRGRAK